MTIHYQGHGVTLHHGDCLDVLRTLPDASVDSVVTDPPYGLGFMGRVTAALRRAGATTEQQEAFAAEAMSGDYDNVLRTAETCLHLWEMGEGEWK